MEGADTQALKTEVEWWSCRNREAFLEITQTSFPNDLALVKSSNYHLRGYRKI